MDILDRIRQRAASRPQHIVLPEGNDPRTVVAAAEATSQRIARITLLGDEETIRHALARIVWILVASRSSITVVRLILTRWFRSSTTCAERKD
jgi:phosphotransacetylase